MMVIAKIVRIALLATALLAPSSAYAYATPEEILFEHSFFIPPTQRDAEDRIIARRKQSAEQKKKDQAEWIAAQHVDDSLESAIAELATAIESLNEEKEPQTAADRRTERLVMRVERNAPYADQRARSNAPLAPTGAGTAVAAFSIFAAVGWTLRKAWRLDQ
jgi:hypothetical protein